MSAKVRFRSGYTCPCVVKWLTLYEAVSICEQRIKNNIDIWQLGYRTDVSASAGTHAAGGVMDIGQLADADLKLQRTYGGCGQRRTRAQGFSMDHNHLFLNGDVHMSSALRVQQRAWLNGRNGLVSNGRITGPGPIGKDTPSWQTGVKKMEEYLVAFADDVAKKVLAGIDYGKIADAVLTRDGKIPNTLTGNPGNEFVSLAGALEALGKRTDYLVKRSITNGDLVGNEYNPADPNTKIAVTTALALLLRRQREQGGDADLSAKLDAILAALPQEPQS